MDKKYVNAMLLGSCLGDAGVEKAVGKNKHPNISFTHNLKKELLFIEHKRDLLSQYYEVGKISESQSKNTARFRISSKEQQLIKTIDKLTRQGNNERRLPTGDDLKYINRVVLLYWYLDDGSLAVGEQKRKGRKNSIYRKLRIALQSFKDEEILEVMDYINKKYGLNFKPFRENGKIVSIGISNNIEEISKFLDLIIPFKKYIPECMHYKFCLAFKPTRQIKDLSFSNYNNCNFHNTGICTCRGKDLSTL